MNSGRDDQAGRPARGEPSAELGRPLRTEELPQAIKCPFCGSKESEQFSTFGSSLSLSQYYCNGCRTVFEAFKWRGREPEMETGAGDPDADRQS